MCKVNKDCFKIASFWNEFFEVTDLKPTEVSKILNLNFKYFSNNILIAIDWNDFPTKLKKTISLYKSLMENLLKNKKISLELASEMNLLISKLADEGVRLYYDYLIDWMKK